MAQRNEIEIRDGDNRDQKKLIGGLHKNSGQDPEGEHASHGTGRPCPPEEVNVKDPSAMLGAEWAKDVFFDKSRRLGELIGISSGVL
jgi:hypothetical protein